MVSMASLHFFRWTEQLNDSGHEVYWFDILDSGKPSDRVSWVHQMVGWKLRWDFPGRYFVKNKFPRIYKFIQKVNNRNTAHEFEKYLLEVKPEVVHSFAMNIAGISIAPIMLKHEKVRWMLSSWGSDLYYLTNSSVYKNKLKSILSRVNYLLTDCNRDFIIAKELGFSGQFLGVFPGGGGFNFEEYEQYIIPTKDRKIIFIKGFQGEIGRCIQILKALEFMILDLLEYKLVIFGADYEVENYINNSHVLNSDIIKVYKKINHDKVLQLMSKSLIYIGNSISDGIPNTLLEAICFGAFPIQSNPGGASAEVIVDGVNGLLINDCEDIIEIKSKIERALSDKELLYNAFSYNMKLREQYEYNYIREKIIKKYQLVENEII